MTEASREVGVVLRRRSIDNPWIDHVWSPAMVLDEVPATAPWTVLSTEADATIYYAGSASIDLFSAETANYRDNLADGEPRIWIALRRQDGGPELELTKVTADPTEGEAMFESGCDVIGTVPMPPEVAAWVAAFVDRFHVERVFHTRKRDRAAGDRPRVPGGRPDEGTGRRRVVRTKPIGTEVSWRDGRSASRRQNSRNRSRTSLQAKAWRRQARPHRKAKTPRRSSISQRCQSSRN
jgi:hypothetical protein